MLGALEKTLVAHRRRMRDPRGPWALKHTRTMFLWRELNALFPDMRFVHVVRDGRDMTFPANTVDFDLYQRVAMPDLDLSLPLPLQLAHFWAYLNQNVATEASAALGSRYLRIRLEDLCADPQAGVQQIVEWLGATEVDLASIASLVRAPDSLGRWRETEPKMAAEIEAATRPTLRALGYPDSADS